MESVETPALICALVLMFGAIGAKILTAQFITHMRRQISDVDRDRNLVLRQLKIAQNQKKVIGKNKTVLTAKKVKLTKRLSRIQRDVNAINEDQKVRTQRSQANRVHRDDPKEAGN